MIDIEKVKNALPLPLLMDRLGHKSSARGKSKCPFHEDKNPSFGIKVVGRKWKWKCYAGCGGGDEIDFVAKAFGLSNGDAIRRYAEIAGVAAEPLPPIVSEAVKMFNGTAIVTHGRLNPKLGEGTVTIIEKPLPEAKPLNEAAKRQLVEWRGYSPEFVEEISQRGIVKLYKGHIAFPAAGGYHYRLKDGSWRYPRNAPPELFVLGEPSRDSRLFVCESTWDALALHEATGHPVICTRGASNSKLAVEFIKTL